MADKDIDKALKGLSKAQKAVVLKRALGASPKSAASKRLAQGSRKVASDKAIKKQLASVPKKKRAAILKRALGMKDAGPMSAADRTKAAEKAAKTRGDVVGGKKEPTGGKPNAGSVSDRKAAEREKMAKTSKRRGDKAGEAMHKEKAAEFKALANRQRALAEKADSKGGAEGKKAGGGKKDKPGGGGGKAAALEKYKKTHATLKGMENTDTDPAKDPKYIKAYDANKKAGAAARKAGASGEEMTSTRKAGSVEARAAAGGGESNNMKVAKSLEKSAMAHEKAGRHEDARIARQGVASALKAEKESKAGGGGAPSDAVKKAAAKAGVKPEDVAQVQPGSRGGKFVTTKNGKKHYIGKGKL